MTQETIDQLANILGSIMAILSIAFILAFCIYMLIYQIKTERMQQDHIKQLDEHDKAVIMDYNNCHWTLKKKKSRNEKI